MTLALTLQEIKKNFEARLDGVNRLAVFENLIIDQTIEILERRQENLRNCGIANAKMLGENSLANLRGIRNHESLKPGYAILHNQCLVLLVSYFSSSVHDVFNKSVSHTLNRQLPKRIARHDIKLTLRDLHELGFDLREDIGSLISRKSNLSFQDMQSIARSLEEFLGIKIERSRTVNNLITALACRHAVAHAGEVVDRKLMQQIRDASPRDIQPSLAIGQRVQFTPAEVKTVGDEMASYIADLIDNILEHTGDA